LRVVPRESIYGRQVVRIHPVPQAEEEYHQRESGEVVRQGRSHSGVSNARVSGTDSAFPDSAAD
jgi:hypothetical protein